jgi:hypothetical protein
MILGEAVIPCVFVDIYIIKMFRLLKNIFEELKHSE